MTAGGSVTSRDGPQASRNDEVKSLDASQKFFETRNDVSRDRVSIFGDPKRCLPRLRIGLWSHELTSRDTSRKSLEAWNEVFRTFVMDSKDSEQGLANLRGSFRRLPVGLRRRAKTSHDTARRSSETRNEVSRNHARAFRVVR